MNEPAGVVTIVAREGRSDELAALLAKMAEVASLDDGAEIYAVHRSRQDANTFFIYERYRDKDSLKRHQANAELRELGARMADLTDAVTVTTGNLVAGDRASRS
jgi:quinol monooxygenase YgiN